MRAAQTPPALSQLNDSIMQPGNLHTVLASSVFAMVPLLLYHLRILQGFRQVPRIQTS